MIVNRGANEMPVLGIVLIGPRKDMARRCSSP